MTDHIKIPARAPRCRFVADGAQRVFAFDFPAFRPEDIEVRVAGAPASAGFVATLGASGTGSVTFDVPPPADAVVVLSRRLAIRRETDFQEGGELRAKSLNDELDFQTAALQQIETAAGRALSLPDDDPDDAPVRLPPAAMRARKALVFDAAGNPTVSADDYADQAANAAASASAAAASAALAGASAAAAAGDAADADASAELALAHRSAASLAATTAIESAADAASAAAALAVAWDMAPGTAMADPGAGLFRFDAATPAAATAIALSAASADAGNPDLSDFVSSWAASTNPGAKGTLVLRKRGTAAAFATFVVHAVADFGTWLRVDVTHVASAGAWTAGEGVRFAFARAGDKGLDGAGTIVSLTAVDAALVVGGTPSDRTIAIAANAVGPAKLARLGTAGQVLTSNGTSADASFQSLPAGVPAGVVVPYAGATEPAGWLFAAGQAVGRATYAALFAALGTTFGAGDGSTTFNLPDLRGRVAAGRDNMNGTAANRLTTGGAGIAGATLGAAGGSETHALTLAQLPAHAHSYVAGGGGMTVAGSFGGNDTTAGAPGGATTTGQAGSGQAHPNAQPTLVLNHIVKT